MKETWEAVFASKPERLNKFPEILSGLEIEEIKSAGRLAIAEIAGRDSVAAVVVAAKDGLFDALIPTVVYVPTEYGDWGAILKTSEALQAEVASRFGKRVFPPLLIGSADLWHALNGRFLSVLNERFGTFSPCPGCHLYMHISRIPIAKLLGARIVITGERESHDGKVKINQTPMALDFYQEVYRAFDLELVMPLRRVASTEEVQALAGGAWSDATNKQLTCVFSANYVRLDGDVSYREGAWRSWFEDYLVPAVKEIISQLIEGRNVEYLRVARKYVADNP